MPEPLDSLHCARQMVAVLQILGKGRSGSTLLDALLGQFQGVFSSGELWRLPEVVAEDRRCTCGAIYAECEVWGRVLSGLRRAAIDLADLAHAQQITMNWHAAPRIGLTTRRRPQGAYELRVRLAQQLYKIIADVTRTSVIVDSSKWPWDPVLLSHGEDLDMSAVHLVRDPRAVAYSWHRHKRFRDGSSKTMDRHSVVHSSLSWIVRNLSVEFVAGTTDIPVKLVRYEDLVSQPRPLISELARFTGQDEADLTWLSDSSVALSPLHLVAGNPDRPLGGRLEIRPDTDWISGLTKSRRRVVEALSWWLMRRYRYHLRTL